MIDDWVIKGHTNVNMFSVVGEQIRSLSSIQSKLNFWNRLHPKIAFLCRFWTQTVKWRSNHTIGTSSVKVTLKAILDTVFWDQFKGGSELFINSGKFFQQERVLWGWLAGPSRMQGFYKYFWQLQWTNLMQWVQHKKVLVLFHVPYLLKTVDWNRTWFFFHCFTNFKINKVLNWQ